LSKSPCILWREPDDRAARRLPGLIEKGLGAGSGTCRVFFRADDIARIDPAFEAMIRLFVKHRAPLGLALVPAWLDSPGWDSLLAACQDRDLWTWHQHGYAHVNHEPQGKKQEFGPSRTAEAKRGDLARGWEHLSRLAGERLAPIFTPPWNRVDAEALKALKVLGFQAVSRSLRPKVPALPGLMELPVAVDPHTRKEPDITAAWAALEDELQKGLASGLCGIMLHHQLMNRAALAWLDALLDKLAAQPGIVLNTMAELKQN
jgi:hypothetical protein